MMMSVSDVARRSAAQIVLLEDKNAISSVS